MLFCSQRLDRNIRTGFGAEITLFLGSQRQLIPSTGNIFSMLKNLALCCFLMN